MTTKAGRAHIEDLKAGTIIWLIEARDSEDVDGESVFSTFPARLVKKPRRLPQLQEMEVMFPRWELVMDFRDPNGNLSRDTLVLSTDNNPYHASGKIVLDNIFVNRRAAERYCARMLLDEDRTKNEHPVASYFYSGVLYYPFRQSGPSFKLKQFKRELRRLKKKNANLKKDEVMVGGVVCNVKRDKRKIAYLMKASAGDLVNMYPERISPFTLQTDPHLGVQPENIVDQKVKIHSDLRVMTTESPNVTEDGILISDEALKKFDFKTYESRAVDFPTNVFDEQNKEQ